MGYDKGESRRGYAQDGRTSEHAAEGDYAITSPGRRTMARGKERERPPLDSGRSSQSTSSKSNQRIASSGGCVAVFSQTSKTLVIRKRISRGAGWALFGIGLFGLLVVWNLVLLIHPILWIVLMLVFGALGLSGILSLRGAFRPVLFALAHRQVMINGAPIAFSDMGHLEIHAPKTAQEMSLDLWWHGKSMSLMQSARRDELWKLGKFIERNTGIAFLAKA